MFRILCIPHLSTAQPRSNLQVKFGASFPFKPRCTINFSAVHQMLHYSQNYQMLPKNYEVFSPSKSAKIYVKYIKTLLKYKFLVFPTKKHFYCRIDYAWHCHSRGLLIFGQNFGILAIVPSVLDEKERCVWSFLVFLSNGSKMANSDYFVQSPYRPPHLLVLQLFGQ